jgi:histidinol-phosphate/aromatic aminotransferase/cobyric acid decarboxylase-like protein
MIQKIDFSTITTNCNLKFGVSRCSSLEEEISDIYSLKKENVLVSNGTITLLKKLFDQIRIRDVTLITPDYFEFAKLCTHKTVIARNKDYSVPTLNTHTDAILISNPNNPSGTVHELEQLVRVTRKNDQLLIVDEAYLEFVNENQTIINLVRDNPHLVVLRTFSKFYSLIKDKVGYVIAHPDIIDGLDVPEANVNAKKEAQLLLNSTNKDYVRADVNKRKVLLINLLSKIADEISCSSVNFLLARNTTYPLKAVMAEINVDVLDLDNTLGLEHRGYVRVAVGSYEQINDFSRRLERWNL